MASFQAKIHRGRQRKRENKNCRSVPFRSCPTGNRKFQKNINKIEKIKKQQYGVFSSQNSQGKAEKIKIVVPFRQYLVQNKKFQRNSKKLKKLKNTIMDSFQAKIGWKRMRKRENKN